MFLRQGAFRLRRGKAPGKRTTHYSRRGGPEVAPRPAERASARPAQLLQPVVAYVRRHADLPFRLTEFNSITCGGLFGVSNSYSTALWAPDAVFERNPVPAADHLVAGSAHPELEAAAADAFGPRQDG